MVGYSLSVTMVTLDATVTFVKVNMRSCQGDVSWWEYFSDYNTKRIRRPSIGFSHGPQPWTLFLDHTRSPLADLWTPTIMASGFALADLCTHWVHTFGSCSHMETVSVAQQRVINIHHTIKYNIVKNQWSVNFMKYYTSRQNSVMEKHHCLQTDFKTLIFNGKKIFHACSCHGFTLWNNLSRHAGYCILKEKVVKFCTWIKVLVSNKYPWILFNSQKKIASLFSC